MASTFILKRKCFDTSAGGHAIPIKKLKEMYNNSGFKGSFRQYRAQQLGIPEQKLIGVSEGVHLEGTGTAGNIDKAYDAAAKNRQQNRAANKALAGGDPNFFKNTNQGKGLLADQQKVQKGLDQKAIKSTGGSVSNVAGGMQTRTTPRPNNTPKPNPATTPKPGAMSLSARWNKMGTMGKAGVITAGAGGAYLLGRSLFGGRKKD